MADPNLNPLDELRRLFGSRFEELAGGHVSGQVPVPERVINAVVAERLSASDGPIETAEVQVRPQGELAVRVRLRRPRFAPPVVVVARIEQQPSPPESWDLVLSWSLPGLGPLAALAGPALAFLRAGPPGIRADGDRIHVDLARLLRDHGAGEALDYLNALRFDTRDGALLVSFGAAVPMR